MTPTTSVTGLTHRFPSSRSIRPFVWGARRPRHRAARGRLHHDAPSDSLRAGMQPLRASHVPRSHPGLHLILQVAVR
jgi:hypothetical protein